MHAYRPMIGYRLYHSRPIVISPSASVSVDGDAMSWFRSYLTDRTQTFVVSEDTHGPLPVNCSAPQGSVLGPIKFISYTDDVP